MKDRKINILEIILLIMMILGMIYSIFDNEILDNKLFLVIFIIIPFVSVLMLEFIKIIETPEKQIKEERENKIQEEIIEMAETLEKEAEKTKNIEETVQIPVNEIKEEIEKLNKKLNKKAEKDLEKTEILFQKGDLKEIIEKEMENAKKKYPKKKSIKTVDKTK